MNVSQAHIRSFLQHRRRSEIDVPGLVHAGVLILLFRRNEELHVILTKRTSDVEHHKGQISFPGGSVDLSDRDVTETALREANEEIGLPPNGVEVLGLFDDFETPSGFRITPVIGFCAALPILTRSVVEVEEILQVPVSIFLDTQNERVEKFVRGDRTIDVYFYRHDGREIWGATAAIMRSFLRALQSSEDNRFARYEGKR